MVESLLTLLCEAKSESEFKGLDFEADLATLYNNIRQKMAAIFENGEFGPTAVIEISNGL